MAAKKTAKAKPAAKKPAAKAASLVNATVTVTAATDSVLIQKQRYMQRG